MASRTDRGRPALVDFLIEALARMRDSRWLPIALLLLVFLGGTNAALALLKPAQGATPGALFAAIALVRLIAAVSIAVAALRIALGSPRRPWMPDGGFWLYFLLGLPGIAVAAALAWLGRDLPLFERVLMMEFGAIAILTPFSVWFVAIAVERPLAFVPRFRRIGAWLPALLLWSLLLVAPLASLHAWLSQRMLDTAGTGGFCRWRRPMPWPPPSSCCSVWRCESPPIALRRAEPPGIASPHPNSRIARTAMAGHSKFKNIMHRKGAQDKKRSNLFSKLSREITVAAKMGLPDPDANARLRAAVTTARAQSMPKDNIQRAIDKASGGDAETYEELRYEGFGPGGVALIVEALTDNRNRTATNMRTAFSKNGGNLGASGSVSHGFERLGLVAYPASAGSADAVFEAAIEAGAEDVESDEDGHQIWTAQEDLHGVARALEDSLGAAESVKLAWRPGAKVEVGADDAGQLMKLIDTLEDDDDVQTVWGNYEVPDEVMEKLS